MSIRIDAGKRLEEVHDAAAKVGQAKMVKQQRNVRDGNYDVDEVKQE